MPVFYRIRLLSPFFKVQRLFAGLKRKRIIPLKPKATNTTSKTTMNKFRQT
jgi:hypothetical protein